MSRKRFRVTMTEGFFFGSLAFLLAGGFLIDFDFTYGGLACIGCAGILFFSFMSIPEHTPPFTQDETDE